MTHRRGFMGGCIAALCVNVLTAGDYPLKTLYWKQVRVGLPTPLPNRPYYGIVVQAQRCDGLLYYVTGEVVNHSSAKDLLPTLRRWLDSYLDPKCSCTPGFDCGIHQEHKHDAAVAEIELKHLDLGIFVAK